MPIRYDREQRRATDTDNGEYIAQPEFYYDSPTRSYVIYAPDGSIICSAEVKRRDIDTRGDKTVGLITIGIVSLTAKTDDGSFISVNDPTSPIVRRFSTMLEAIAIGPLERRPIVEISADELGAPLEGNR